MINLPLYKKEAIAHAVNMVRSESVEFHYRCLKKFQRIDRTYRRVRATKTTFPYTQDSNAPCGCFCVELLSNHEVPAQRYRAIKSWSVLSSWAWQELSLEWKSIFDTKKAFLLLNVHICFWKSVFY